jgi:SAM-dependent methyltransferase
MHRTTVVAPGRHAARNFDGRVTKRYPAIISKSRVPFHEISKRYIAALPVALVIDIGGGNNEFARVVSDMQVQVEVLDSRPQPWEGVSIQYQVPHKLPYECETVGMVHMSHLIEHLGLQELLELLREIDRVLAPGGMLMISAPLLWDGFYDDLTHVRPYSPDALNWYLTDMEGPISASKVSARYQEVERVYRGRAVDFMGNLSSSIAFVRGLLYILRELGRAARISQVECTGYTSVWRKT